MLRHIHKTSLSRLSGGKVPRQRALRQVASLSRLSGGKVALVTLLICPASLSRLSGGKGTARSEKSRQDFSKPPIRREGQCGPRSGGMAVSKPPIRREGISALSSTC